MTGIRVWIWATSSLGSPVMIVQVCNHSSGGRFLPAFPEARENKGRIVLHPDRIGDLSADDLFPFVEAVLWYQAAPFFEGLPVRWRRIDPFHPRIDRFVRDFRSGSGV